MIKQVDKVEFSSVIAGILVCEFVDKGKNITFKAKGNSMLPFIKDGDTIKIAPYIENTPEVGDIVAYIDSNTRKLVVHRLIQLSEEQFIAKGDNCLHRDGPQFTTDILGYVVNIHQGLVLLKKMITFLSLIRGSLILGMAVKRLGSRNEF
ncbi:MAG: hypothetical protein GY737_20850 [Desulfobacteraceae bacterium]|nr:hypothetical protein [Desulfobacteraceae bacterium]